MANLIFKKGTYADFKEKVVTAQEGAFYLTEDEGGLYVGLSDGSTKRIQGSVLIYDDIDAIVEAAGLPPYDPNVIYFSAKDNALFRYDDSGVTGEWIQLNQTAQDVTTALNALKTSISNVESALNSYKTSNDKAVGLKADASALAEEVSRAKAAEGINATAAATAKTAADNAQETANTAVTNAAANATKINSLTSDLATVKTTAESKTTMAEVEAKGYATVAQVNSAKSEVIGSSGDASTKNTIYGAKAAAAAAQSAAEAAQSTANSASSAATANATAIADETKRAKAAEEVLTTAVEAKVEQSTYNTKISALEKSISDNASAAEAANTLAKNAMPKAGGTFTGNVTVQTGANLILTDAPGDDLHAVNKSYVDNKVKEANNVSSGLDTRLTQAEKDIKTNAANITMAQGTADGAQSTANTAVANAKKAQETADSAVAAAKSANDNANTRVLQDDYDADKAVLDQGIANNSSAITAVQTALNEYKTANNAAVAKKLDATVAADTYATKVELNTAKSTLLGSSADTSDKNTIYGVQKGVSEAKSAAANAKSAADGAQTTANSANATATANTTAIADEKKRAEAAEATLTTAVGKKVDQTAYDSKVATLEASIKTNASAASAAQTTANNAMPKAGGTFTGNVAMSNKKITGLATPTDDTDAANKKYVDDTMAAADAMVFQGVLGTGTGMIKSLPTSGVQKGWTYKVGTAGDYGTIAGKVGDLIINTGEDNATPVWVHVTSGYEDDYLQKMSINSNNGVEIRLNDGISSIVSSIVLKNSNGIEWTVNGTEATPSIVWGTF